jgi:hypothetical protein
MERQTRVTGGLVAKTPLELYAADAFRFTWWHTRDGATCWFEYRGSLRTGVVVHRARRFVTVMLTGMKWRARYVRREYGDLRRRSERQR